MLIVCVLGIVRFAAAQGEVAAHFDEPIGPPIAGFGAEMNPYLYASPNWGKVTEENVKDLEQKVVDLKPQFVRVFFDPGWLRNGPDGINKQGEPRMRESLLRTLRLAARAGANISLTTWYGHPSEPERTAKETVDGLVELMDKEKINAIKSINMMNEPDMTWPNEENWTIDEYNRLYRALDKELKHAGLRESLQIISGDMVEDFQPAWQANIAKNLADISDAISIHAYWRYDDTDFMLKRLDETKRMAATQPSIKDKPFYITEFGSQGIRRKEGPGDEPWWDREGHPMAETTTQALQIGWFMIEALNRGFAGTIQWDMYDVAYDKQMHYGVIGEPKDWPLKPAYFVLEMFTHSSQPGWRAVKSTSENPETVACAIAGKDDGRTLYLLNRADKEASVNISGFKGGWPLVAYTWNADGKGKSLDRRVGDAASLAKMKLPPRSITSISNHEEKPQ
jgi:hypothetical protein